MSVAYAIIENGTLTSAAGTDRAVPWWSFGKALVATAALKLVEQGRLSLDDPIKGRSFSLAQLLQHRAGLADYGGLADYHAAVARGDMPWSDEALIERVGTERQTAPWQYSNIGYLLVRRLIEQATGDDLQGALDALVLHPLGIFDVRVATVPADIAGIDGIAAGYHPGWVYPGLVIGPTASAARALDCILRGMVIPKTLLARMRAGHVVGGPVPGRPWRTPGYGLGLMTGIDIDERRVEGHSGGGPGSVIAVYHGEATGRTVAAFACADDPAVVERAAFAMID